MTSDASSLQRIAPLLDLTRLAGCELRVSDLLPPSGMVRTDLVFEPSSGLAWLIRAASLTQSIACQRLQREAQVASGAPARAGLPPLQTLWAPDRILAACPVAPAVTSFKRLGAGRVSLAAFLDLAAAAVEAVQALHEAGLVHGDLRTEHLLAGEGGAVHLIAALGDADGVLPLLDDGALPFRAPELDADAAAGPTVAADLYALGVALFELLTGRLPWSARHAAAWSHAHAAAVPARAGALRSDAPPAVDAILGALLAKDPSVRYARASDLLGDLHKVQQAWRTTGSAGDFWPQVPRRLAAVATTRLVGRDAQQAILLAALQRVAPGQLAELALIAGGAGGGKSALARWLMQTAVSQGAVAAVGKCDQQQQDIPFAPIAQVLQGLTSQLLGADQRRLDEVRERWLARLQGQGQAVAELVPEVELVLGASPALSNVAAAQARARMEQALLQSLGAFADGQRPLVVFLDDLQWADSATLELLEAFVVQPPAGVLLLGAFRDSGPDAARAQALVGRVASARHASRALPVGLTELALAPLSLIEVGELLGEVLGPDAPQRTEELARAIYTRTGGNPYFSHQLIKTFIDEGVLQRDSAQGSWTWDPSALKSGQYSDRVLDLMVRRFARLPPQATEVAKHLASVGISCEAGLLARLAGLSLAELAQALQPFVEAGLVAPTPQGYAFEHDRVLESAYALIEPAQVAAVHARVADAMLAHWASELSEHAFEICNQIERAAALPPTAAQREAFVSVLLLAGRRAKRASALTQAHTFIERALTLMPEGLWATQPDTAFGVHALRCECLLAQAQLPEAAQQIQSLLQRDLSVLHKATAHRLDAVLHTIRSDYEAAIDTALTGLRLLGVELRRHPSPAEMREVFETTMGLLGGSARIAALAQLPECQDPQVEPVMGLLSTLLSSVFVSDGISFLHLAKMVELTVKHGATPESPHGLAWFGVYCVSLYQTYDDALSFCNAALALIDRHGYEAERISTLVAIDQCAVWSRPMDYALRHAQQAARLGLASGDAGMACYAYNHIVSDLLVMGRPLALVREELDKGLALTRSIQYVDIELLLLSQQQYVEVLGGPAGDGDAAVGLDAEAALQGTLRRAEQSHSLPTRFWTRLYGGMALFQLGAYDAAVEQLRLAETLAWSAPAHVTIAEADLYLCLAAARSSMATQDLAAVRALLQERLQRFARWAANNPQTFQSKQQLLASELLRLEGQPLQALAGFERSAQMAGAAGFVHEQGLALEFAGLLCLQQELAVPARTYLLAAREHYLTWGAMRRARQIEATLPLLGGPEAGGVGRHDMSQAAWELGVSAAQALSVEGVMAPLVQTLMTHLMLHAGATYGVLVLMRQGAYRVAASARVVDGQVRVAEADSEPIEKTLPLAILNSVARTRSPLVLRDGAELSGPVASGAGPLRSVLCVPLLRGEQLTGVIYFENGLAAGVFNEQRAARIELMLPQVAIALESARLYEQLIDESHRRLDAEMSLRAARAELAKTSHLTVLANLAASIAHEVNQPLASIVTLADASLRWLNRPVPNLDEVTAGLVGIRDDGLRAAEVIRAVKALARQAPSRYELLSVDTVLADVLRILSADLAAHQVRVRFEPGATPPVPADRAQLQQLALNLVSNAMDAMADTPVSQREVRVSSVRQGDQVMVQVADTGPGVDAELLEKIFDPFFTTKSAGLGMGLSICRTIVASHGGQLSAARRESGGTVFTFSMPMGPGEAPGAALTEDK